MKFKFPVISPSIRHVTSRLSLAVLMFALAVSISFPIKSHAQDGGISVDIGAEISKALSKAFSDAAKYRITVPPVVKVNPKTSTGVIEFSNPSDDTLSAEVTVAGWQSAEKPKQTSPLLADDKNEVIDSNTSTRSLASWLTDVPTTIRLGPGEKKSVTIKVVAPASTKPGEYTAALVVSTKARMQGNVISANTGGQGQTTVIFGGEGQHCIGDDCHPMRQTSKVKVVYTVSARK